MSGLEPLLLAGAAGGGSSLGAIAGVGASVLSGVGSLMSASATAEAQRAEAAMLERQAGETNAAAQRNAERKRKEAALINSRQQAVAAKSGGGATDPTVLDLMAGVAGEGDLQARSIQYEGAERGASLSYQAALKRMAAENAETAGYIGAGTSLLSGVNNWSKYRMGYYGQGGYERYLYPSGVP
jgi:hypothetical protein